MLELALFHAFKCFNVLLSYGDNPNTKVKSILLLIIIEGTLITVSAQIGNYPAMASLIKHGANVFSLDKNSHNILTILINNLSIDYYNTLEYLNILINQYIY